MILNIYAAYDKKAQAYGNPSYFRFVGQATRALSDAISDSQSAISRHPEDFALYCLGTYDEGTGQISPVFPPEFVAEALAVKASKEVS